MKEFPSELRVAEPVPDSTQSVKDSVQLKEYEEPLTVPVMLVV